MYDLVDFTQAVQNYAMAIHSVRQERILKAGLKVRKLIQDLTKDHNQEVEEGLLKAMDALENAASEFLNMTNEVARKRRKVREEELILTRTKLEIDSMQQEAREQVRRAESRTADAMLRSHEAHERWQQALAQAQQNEERAKNLEERERKLVEEKHELANQKRMSAVQSNLAISNMKSVTEKKVIDAKNKLQAALKDRDEANREREATHQKNLTLAQQLRDLQARVTASKKAQPVQPAKTNLTELAARDRTIKALRAQTESLQAQLRSLGVATPDHRLSRTSNRLTQEGFVDLTRSSSPSSMDADWSPATPKDGQEITSQASTSAAATAKSPTPKRKNSKTGRTSLSVEPERLDDEMDEDLFPMPGLPAKRQRAAAGINVWARTYTAAPPVDDASSSSSSTPLASRVGGRGRSKTPPGNAAKTKGKGKAPTPSKGKENANHAWLHNAKGIQLGPKHRPKAG